MAEKYGDVKSLSFLQKIDHYWHYYWKLFVGIMIVLSVVIAGTVSCLANERYDASFLIATRGKLLNSSAPITKALEVAVERYAVDTDGNGEVNVLGDAIPFPATNAEYATDNETAMQTRLSGELQLGDSQMYIMDRHMFEFLLPLEGFMDLTEVFPDRDIPLVYGIPLTDTTLGDIEVAIPEEGLAKGQTLKQYKEDTQAILEDLVLTFRIDENLKPERRAVQWELFKRIVNDEPTVAE